MRKQSIIIISLIVIGTLFGIGYASSTSISDSGIITPSLTVNGQQVGEGSFTSWATALNQTVTGTSGDRATSVNIANSGTVVFLNNAGKLGYVFLNGTNVITPYIPPGSFLTNYEVPLAQSSGGEYQVTLISSGIHVYKNNVLKQTLGLTSTQFTGGNLNTISISISPNGKYITAVGEDSGGALNRLVIFQGS